MARLLAGLAASAALALALTAAPREAAAFCGFYVGSADAKLFNNATQVALMRDGTRTVVTMQNDYQGPPRSFAMVVPVPVVLTAANVKTLSLEFFARLDQFTAPRLVEYHEADPCRRDDGGYGYGFDDDPLTAGGFGPNDAVIRVRPGPVRVLQRFTAGEYEVVILSADDSMGLDAWLRQNGYQIPAGAEPYLRPYVAAGDKFFVAKVNPQKVTFQDGKARLSPLRFFYDSPTFSLPVRLGLINARGPQDLIVYVLGRHQRYEVANRSNVAAPTNLVVKPETRASFGPFYAGLFDRIQAEKPGSVVTEYSWPVGSCDPCPTEPLTTQDLQALGADVMPRSAPPPSDDMIGLGIEEDWVVTRLHTRQDRHSTTDDLVFSQVPPIEGGRGVPDVGGALERAVRFSAANQFQARYAVVKRWQGKIECERPRRGSWVYEPGASAFDPGETAPVSTPLAGFLAEGQPVELLRLGGAQPVSSGPLSLRTGGCAGCAVSSPPTQPPALAALAIALAALTSRRRRPR